MDFVTITDHNTLDGSLAIAHLPGTFLSCEFDAWFPEDRQRVHVVALGIDERTFAAADQARQNVYDLVACLREADVTHFLAHPLFDMSGRLTPDSVERMLLLFNVLEGRNGARTTRSNGLLRAHRRTAHAGAGRRYGRAPGHRAVRRVPLAQGAHRRLRRPQRPLRRQRLHRGRRRRHAARLSARRRRRRLRRTAASTATRALLAHSIYAASFWKIRELLRLDEQEGQKRGRRPAAQGLRAHRPRRTRAREDAPRRAQHGAGLVPGRRHSRSLLGGAPRTRDRQPRSPHPDGLNAVDAQ